MKVTNCGGDLAAASFKMPSMVLRRARGPPHDPCRIMLRCASMLPHGLQDELAVRLALCLQLCRVMLQCALMLPHGLQDELAVRRMIPTLPIPEGG